MSTHDRGAFGALLAEAKALGATLVQWNLDLSRTDEDEKRWSVMASGLEIGREFKATGARGRTGEEALRRLVEKLRG